MNIYELFEAGGTGVVASKKQASDPRYSMSLTKDVRPGEIDRQLKKYALAEDQEQNYDDVLVELCELIIKNKRKDNANGFVAAAVIGDGKKVCATSHFEGKWAHAERRALDKFKSMYGEIPDDAVIVTTLSPCVDDMPDRQGISCNELIETTPVKMVYCGYRDPEHQESTHNDFDIRFTNNTQLTELCKEFADTFQKDNLKESVQPKLREVGNIFVKYCAKNLGIKRLPVIKLVREIGSSEHPTFGLFDANTNSISVAYKNRHIMDVMRTLAHELTHHKQREENRIKPDSGETGSDIENEANAQAGVLMRDFADQNPGLFSNKIDENVIHPDTEEVIRQYSPTPDIRFAVKQAKRMNGKVVRSVGSTFIAVPKTDPRPSVRMNNDYYDKFIPLKEKLKQIRDEMSAMRSEFQRGNFTPEMRQHLKVLDKQRIEAMSAIDILKSTVPNYIQNTLP